MIDYVISAGLEYGVDPNRILAIIQQETAFNGLSPKVVGVNGKGYMQLTSAPIKDFLGYGASGSYGENKSGSYGREIDELLLSRGFDVNCPTPLKNTLNKDIMAYLVDNKDGEFNIRLGTIVLRHYLDKYNGDMYMASWNYNGNAALAKNGRSVRDNYRESVAGFCNELSKTVCADSSYVVKIVPLEEMYM